MDTCPCGSGRAYDDCCGMYISGKAKAPTAEALMRSRYTSYVKGAIDYIVSTCTAGGKDDIDVEATRRWSQDSKWLGLKIVSTAKGGPDDSEGTVEFVSSYEENGLREDYHEIGKFVKKDGGWLYSEGSIVPTTVVRAAPKVGRNDPCPCGSGKKYKKCCGANKS